MELRKDWRYKLLREHPSIQSKNVGMPITTNGISQGLSLIADLFIDKNDSIIIPDKYWENYETIFHVRSGGYLKIFKLFDEDNKFNVSAFRACLMEQKDVGKAIILFNFPNNPTGHTPHEAEVEGIISAMLEAAEAGINIALILDDAYFWTFLWRFY